MTTDAISGKSISGPWKDYASFMLEDLQEQGQIILIESRTVTAILPGPVPIVFLARKGDADWALKEVELLINAGRVG